MDTMRVKCLQHDFNYARELAAWSLPERGG